MNQFIDLVPLEAQKKAEETEVMVKDYDNYVIATNEAYTGAAEHLKAIKAKTKELDDLRKSLTRPLDESKRRIMDFFQKPIDWLSRAEAKGKEEKAEELRRQAQEAEAIVPIVALKVEKINGIATKKVWKFKIVKETLIPREYLMPNEKMLGEVARATKGTLKVEGVEFFSEDIISAGR